MFSNAKNFIREPLNKYKSSRAYFEKMHKYYFKNHPITNKVTGGNESLRTLQENGFVVLPDFYKRGEIEKLRKTFFPMVEKVRNNTYSEFNSNDIVRYEEDGIYRIRNIQDYVQEATSFLENDYLLNIVKKYTYYPIKSSMGYVDYKPEVGVHDGTTTMHMDQWRPSLKIFTLLTDINKLTAPLVYWKRTHKPELWRRRIDYFNSVGMDEGSGYCPALLVSDFEKITITGTAGTVVIADTRGIHRASNLYKDYRMELVQKFTSDFYPKFIDVMKG